ncbi:putative glucan 1, 4-alpha-glucosidase [Cercophora samala]|uniref:Glucan 1, 4-alpha-glucosidase n=1 Tax=Cercophora samala TaxID=330535 RepID=A0AA39YWY8_9PEZI|nr:putative glucan 1, 4-alpha-glucosidase [Cercophora samala]
MDDPWRSPWTATDVDPDKDHKPPSRSPSKSDLAPPPRALLSGSSSPRISAAVESSPWGDDGDGFGDWAGASTPAADASSVHSGWGGGWATSPNLAPVRRDDDSGRLSPIAWPGNIATPKPANGSAFRQPSPDPWASESSFDRRPTEIDAPQVVVDLASPRAATFETLHDSTNLGAIGLDAGWHSASVEENGAGPTEVADPLKHEEKRVEDPIQLPNQNSEIRSYTPSNEETDHDDDHQDSPITSIDEDHRGRQREPGRPAGKVQELVVKFDGLAKAKSQESLRVPRPKSSGSMDKRDASSENGEFSEFEDTEEVGPCPPPDPVEQPVAPQNSEDAERPVTPPSSQDVESPLTPPSSKPKCEDGTPMKAFSQETASTATSPAAAPRTRIDRPTFAVNLDKVSELFESMKVPASLPIINIDGEIPERVITDSFSEISERKVWYRLSRLGSTRRHNAADEDSYRRVTWPTSTVRQEVIAIVRRWMEEDSIAGRVALGGGISKTQKNMFGWDSSAEPVGLDAVFGKRKPESRPTPPEPIQISDPPASVVKEPNPISSRSAHSLASPPPALQSPPVASFGWSESPAFAPAPTTILAPPPRPSTGRNAPSASHSTANHSRTASQPSVIAAVFPPTPTPEANHDEEEDDEEDWGEMVSSPIESKPAGFQSFDDAFALPVTPTPVQALADGEATGDPNPPTNDPWSTTDLSMFDAPALTSSQSKAPAALPTPSDTPTTLAFSPIVVTFPLSLSETPTPSPTFKPPAQTSPPPPPPKTLLNARPFTPSVPSRLSEHMSVPPDVVEPVQDPINEHTTNDDEVAKQIISNLPDLSYMLR